MIEALTITRPEIDGTPCLPNRSIGCSAFMSTVFNV
jgi:hypothetical protein